MGASDFLDKVLDDFVCVADLITSVAQSNEITILSLQESARAVFGCLRSVDEPPKEMMLDSAGLPIPDPDGRASLSLLQVAGSAAYSDIRIDEFDSVLGTGNADILSFGFSSKIWAFLSDHGIRTNWRLDVKTGLRKYSALATVWAATPREISVFLEEHGYKRPVIISLIRKGYAIPIISLVGALKRTELLEIDQKVDLGDVSRWLSKNGVEWPIPVMVKRVPSKYSNDIPSPSSDDNREGLFVRLKALERQNTDLLQQNSDLKAQLLSFKSSSIGQGASQQGLNFPYVTKELEVMRQVALKYWAQYSPEMRQPKQDEIQREFCSLLGLNVPAEKTPPHKAIYLATAIKPDHLLKP